MDEINKLKKEIESLSLKSEGIKLEYEYVNSLKDRRIEELKGKLKESKEYAKNKREEQIYYKQEFDVVVEKMEEYKTKLEQIENSKWWKLRNKLKRGK